MTPNLSNAAEIELSSPAGRSWLAQPWVAPLAVFVLVTVLWEGAVRLFNPPAFILPSPVGIAQTFLANAGELFYYGFNTFTEALGGFVIGSTLGILVAMVVARNRWLAELLLPVAVASNSVPIVALAPIAIVWFGVGPESKVAIVAVMCFFPVMLSTVRGLTAAAPDAVALLKSYAASDWQIFTMLRLPSALPFIFNALKICTSVSMIGAIVSEFFGGAVSFLGLYIKTQASILKTEEAWAAIVVACFYGLSFYFVVSLVEKRVMPWKRQE